MSTPTRPVLRYHGGKWRLAPWIIAHLPPHRVYVEPFGGGASVLIRKPRAYAEVYNDLDDEVVGLFRVLRDPASAARLIETLRLTPFARTEFLAAYAPSDDPVEAARRLITRSFMGFGCNAIRRERTTGFRASSNRSGTTPAHDWRNLPDCLPPLVERLAGVVIERMDAGEILRRHDGPDTLFYVDPPYVHETRSSKTYGQGLYHTYRHDMVDDDHRRLAAQLHGLAGMVVLSGYPCPLYEDLFPDWRRVTIAAMADGGRARTEVLWINARAAAALDVRAMPLFGRTDMTGEAAE